MDLDFKVKIRVGQHSIEKAVVVLAGICLAKKANSFFRCRNIFYCILFYRSLGYEATLGGDTLRV